MFNHARHCHFVCSKIPGSATNAFENHRCHLPWGSSKIIRKRPDLRQVFPRLNDIAGFNRRPDRFIDHTEVAPVFRTGG